MQLSKIELPAEAPFYKPVAPFPAAILRQKAQLNANQSQNETCHLLLDLQHSRIRYLEGQSIGVLPPGVDDRGKSHKIRLYSVASSRFGEPCSSSDPDHPPLQMHPSHQLLQPPQPPQSVAITVKRVLEYDSEDSQKIVHRGVATNYLLDLPMESKLQITGPVGRAFVLPQNPRTNLLLVATGTGIAPFRAFLQYAWHALEGGWLGKVFLFFGARCQQELLYCNDQNQDILDFARQFTNIHLFFARSREQKNRENGRLYVSDLLLEEKRLVYDLLTQQNSGYGLAVYLCGLRAMAKSVEQAVAIICQEKGRDGADWIRKLKLQKRWNVDVY